MTGFVSSTQPDDLYLRAYHQPALQGGDYTLSAQQKLTVSESDTARSLQEATQALSIYSPSLRLPSPSDVLAVYPSPGGSETANVLANVVLSHSTIPWEVAVIDEEDYGVAETPDSTNHVPWLAVLTLSEDELVASFPAAAGGKPTLTTSRMGSVATTVSALRLVDGLAVPDFGDRQSPSSSSATSGSSTPEQTTDTATATTTTDDRTLNALLLSAPLFKAFFPPMLPLPANTTAVQKAVNDVRAYGFLAHARTSGSVQSSIVISPRTPPASISKPLRMISHLVSLRGVSRLAVGSNIVVALASLHAWEWTAVPNAPQTPETMLEALTVQPLCMLNTPRVNGVVTSGSWLDDKLAQGYAIRRYQSFLLGGSSSVATSMTASSDGDDDDASSFCLLRGPLLPEASVPHTWAVDSSNDGSEFTLVDSTTGLTDLTYSSAWALGRALAFANANFSSSLLRLRTKLRSSAASSAAHATQVKNGTGLDSHVDYLKAIPAAISAAASAHSDTTGLSGSSAILRWWRDDAEQTEDPAHLAAQNLQPNQQAYLAALKTAAETLFDITAGVVGTALDPDAATVRDWVIRQMFLTDVPFHYLFTTQDAIPPESIRTFSVDEAWTNAFVDGALSVANHLAADDDVVRREIKRAVNTGLSTPSTTTRLSTIATAATDTDADATTTTTASISTPKPPVWGIVLRSALLPTCPSIKVEVLVSPLGDDSQGSVTLQTQQLAPDILLCFLDCDPSDPTFGSLRISLPAHHQIMQVGVTLDAKQLQTVTKPPPTSAYVDPTSYGNAQTASWTPKDNLYDWDTNMIQPVAYAKALLDSSSPWASDCPSSVLALLLGRPIPYLCIPVSTSSKTTSLSGGTSSPVSLTASRSATASRTLRVNVPTTTIPPPSPPSPTKSQSSTSSTTTSIPKIPTTPVQPTVPTKPTYKPVLPTEPIYAVWPVINIPKKKILGSIQIKDIRNPSYTSKVTSYPCLAQPNYFGPTDLVVQLRDFDSNGRPSYDGFDFDTMITAVRVAIPVSCETLDSLAEQNPSSLALPCTGSSGAVSIDTTQPTLLRIAGTPTAPDLPRVRAIDQTILWTYRSSLQIGQIPLSSGAPDGVSQLFLVVEARLRKGANPAGSPTNASFILENARPWMCPNYNDYGVAVVVFVDATDHASGTSMTAFHSLTVHVVESQVT